MIRGLLNAGLVPARGLIATPFHDRDAARQLEAELRRALPRLRRPRRRRTARAAWRFCFSGHPVPTAASVEAGEHALALARGAAPDDHLLVLLSGGASALLAAPADGLTLDDKMQATRALLGGGAAIHELNGGAQASVGDQGRTAGRGGAVSGDDAGDLGRDFTGGRRPQRDRLGADRA